VANLDNVELERISRARRALPISTYLGASAAADSESKELAGNLSTVELDGGEGGAWPSMGCETPRSIE
jgi:hypothetical protein